MIALLAERKYRCNFSQQISTNGIRERGERIAVHSVEELYKTYEKRPPKIIEGQTFTVSEGCSISELRSRLLLGMWG